MMRPLMSADDLTLEELLALHPWPPEHAALPRLEWLWKFDVPLGVDEVWRVVADRRG